MGKEVKKVEEKPLSAEESVLIMSCLNSKVAKAAIKSAKENNVEVVILEDKVLHDYLKTKQSNVNSSIGDFLNNTSNRLQAKAQAVKLWNILFPGNDYEKTTTDTLVFTRAEVTRKTSLSHKEAESVLSLLRAFNYIEFVKGNYEFVFTFDKEIQREIIGKGIKALIDAVATDLIRYKNIIFDDDNLTEEQKKEKLKSFIKTLKDSIK